MMPPANSAFDLNLQPKMPPILMPAAEKAKVVMPMRAADKKIFTFKKAKVIPTARASILVATAMTNMVLKAKELLTASSSAAKDSFIMLRPIKNRRIKATQWSKADMYFMNVLPRK